MLPTDLTDSGDWDFMAAFSAMEPKAAPQRVLVYVESDDDIVFWRNVLAPFEQNIICFDIQLPTKNGLEKGKLAALEKQAGSHLIICVDSDYDYLLQNTTELSKKINNNPFIFQTYAYSIENLYCYSANLRQLCVQATQNDTQLIDLEVIIKLYSKIIYKLFIWSVHFALKQDTDSFPLATFCDTVKILDKADVHEKFESALKGVKERVTAKIAVLETHFSAEIAFIEPLAEKLKQLGLHQDNTYLFVQGHTIQDNVVLMLIKPICSLLQAEKQQQIKNFSKAIPADMNKYSKHIKKFSIEMLLLSHTAFQKCDLYLKIHEDLEQYIENFPKKIK